MPPGQEQRGVFRTRAEQVPRFEGTRDPPHPKLRGLDGNLVPSLADLEKGECPSGKSRIFTLKAGLDNVEKHVRQEFHW